MENLFNCAPKRRPGRPRKSAPPATPAHAPARPAAKGTPASNGVHVPATSAPPDPAHRCTHPGHHVEARVYVGDCRDLIPRIPECAAGQVDLVFADPPFNWNRAYDQWHDGMPREDYLKFTGEWLDACIAAVSPHGAFWVNIPDDTAAEIVMHLKGRGLHMINWCIWHYRFGQNTTGRFISSKVHALYFARTREPRREHREKTEFNVATRVAAPDDPRRVWNPGEVLEVSDRRSIYADARTESKRDGMPAGMRLPMDVWYGQYWGRIQGNNFERRANHNNQLPETYLERVVRATSNPGDLVLDPFLGSGTTGVVAHALGRRFIGIEYSAANATSAFERIGEGPARELQGAGKSTAIFKSRRKKPRDKGETDAI
jgi:adenine-specific DNA-methyltransferase